jgi:5-formyltetrahydrofolate cyclo-ligase
MGIKQEKEKLRARLRARRKSISESDFLRQSASITDVLQKQEKYRQGEVIHCYVSMNDRREVNTQPLIKEMLKANKEVVVPVTEFEGQSLQHVGLKTFSDLELNKWGVLEPQDGEERPLSNIDLVIVPMVGGDEQAQRIGYGGGFYDRFLSEVSCPTIGLCFEQNIIPSLPTEDFDIALDKIITEKRIITS